MSQQVYRVLFHDRNYALTWAANLISLLGSNLYFIALMWLVWSNGHSTIQTSVFALIYDLPQLILGLWIGTLLGKFRPRNILLLSDIVRGLVVSAVFVFLSTGHFALWILYFAILSEGIMLVIARPSFNTLMPLIVESEYLEPANALLQISTRLIGVAGFGVSGLIVSTIGSMSIVVYNALSFFISAALMLRIRVTKGPGRPAKRSVFQSFKSGFTYLGQEKSLLVIFATGILMNVGGAPITVLGPALTQTVLRSNASGYGFMQGAWFLGIALGAYFIGRRKTKNVWMFLWLGFSIQGLAQICLSFSTSLPMAMLILVVHGVFMSVANIPLFSFVQRIVPQEFLSHVFSILGTIVMAVNPLAYAGSGILARAIGVQATYLAGGFLPLIAALLIITLLPRKIGSREVAVTVD